jgi:S-DNA-T family DNA segregation ATPase FtsK/SpoIIIE
VGPGGDEGATLLVDLIRTAGLLISGSPGSGRSTALESFATRLRRSGAAVVHLGRQHSRPYDLDGSAAEAMWIEPTDDRGMAEWLAGHAGQPRVVVADDVGMPAEWPALAGLPIPGTGSGVVLLAAGAASSLAGHYQGPVAALRRARSGLLLCPGAGDADLLGVRLPRTPLPVRPGSGWLVTGPRIDRVQVARRSAELPAPRPEPPVPGRVTHHPAAEPSQSSSSAGPISCRAYQPSS